MGKQYLDVFRPETYQRSKRVCSVPVNPDAVEALKVFQLGRTLRDIDRVRHTDTLGRAQRMKTVRSLRKLLAKRSKRCDHPVTDLVQTNHFVCIRDGNLADQGRKVKHPFQSQAWFEERERTANQCVVFEIPHGELTVTGQLAEYTDRGKHIQLRPILNYRPVIERVITVRGKQVAVDAGIADWIAGLNEAGYVTTASHSGLTKDHFGFRDQFGGMVLFKYPDQNAEAFRKCITTAAQVTGNTYSASSEHQHISVHFPPNADWRDVSPTEYDRQIAKGIRAFSTALIFEKCDALM